ncbi:glycosyltransferase family 2 protein [Streptomyces sp. NPDC051572]|uniref:glycosyltransferase family 2 protein n=1 Tax=unclassified Streptomyces TaxID=2593676 RepID=UPI00344CE694
MSTPSNRTVTISVPYHRCSGTIRRTIELLLAQTHRDLRVVIVNDGDTVTPPWPHLAHIDDPRLIRFDLPVNRGRYFADAVTLEACDTEWFAVHDADDWSEPEWLAELLESAERSGADAAFSPQVLHPMDEAAYVEPVVGLDTPGPEMRQLAHHAAIYRTEALRRAGGYHPGFRVGYDTLVVNLMVLCGRVTATDRALYHRVARPDSLCTSPVSGGGSPMRERAAQRLHEMYGLALEAGSAAPVLADIPASLLAEVRAEARRLAATVPGVPTEPRV